MEKRPLTGLYWEKGRFGLVFLLGRVFSKVYFSTLKIPFPIILSLLHRPLVWEPERGFRKCILHSGTGGRERNWEQRLWDGIIDSDVVGEISSLVDVFEPLFLVKILRECIKRFNIMRKMLLSPFLSAKMSDLINHFVLSLSQLSRKRSRDFAIRIFVRREVLCFWRNCTVRWWHFKTFT